MGIIAAASSWIMAREIIRRAAERANHERAERLAAMSRHPAGHARVDAGTYTPSPRRPR